MTVKVWASSCCHLHLGTAWPATLLHWQFAYRRNLFSAGQRQREVAEDKRQEGKASPWEQPGLSPRAGRDAADGPPRCSCRCGWAVHVCPGDNCRDSRPTAAQQQRCRGRKTSRLTSISAKRLHKAFLPVASSGHSPWSLN